MVRRELSWVNKKNESPAKLRPATRLPGLLLAAGWQVPCGCQLARGLCWKGAARGVVSRAIWRSTSPPTNPPTNSRFLRFGNGFSWACKSKNPAKSWVFASIRNAKGSLKEFLNRRSQVRIPPGTLKKPSFLLGFFVSALPMVSSIPQRHTATIRHCGYLASF